MTPFELLTLSAASWYIAYALTATHGPFNVFLWIREHIPLGGLTSCIICLAPWVAAALYLLHIDALTNVLAIAGVALWAHSYSNWRMKL